MTYRIADVCSCAGLAADGYAAVFGPDAVDGYDIEDQPDYPYTFTRGDGIWLLISGALDDYDGAHFSWPCQAHTTAGHLRTAQGGTTRFPDLLTPGLSLTRQLYGHRPWVVENVDDRSGNVRRIMAPQPGETLIVLCGSMFGLQVQRHRLFLANFPLTAPDPVPGPGKYRAQGCDHSTFPPDPITGRPRPWGVYHVPADTVPEGGRTCRDADHAREVMGVDRPLPWDKLKEGFPPAYTRWVGRDLKAEIDRRRAQVAA